MKKTLLCLFLMALVPMMNVSAAPIKVDDCEVTTGSIKYKDYVKITIGSLYVHSGWKRFFLHPAIQKDMKKGTEGNLIWFQNSATDGSYTQKIEVKLEPGNIVYVDFYITRHDVETQGGYSLIPFEIPFELMKGAKINGKDVKEYKPSQEMTIENLGYKIKISSTSGGAWFYARPLSGYAIGHSYGNLKPGEEKHLGAKLEFSGDMEGAAVCEPTQAFKVPKELVQAYSTPKDEFIVIPQPQEMRLKEGKFLLDPNTKIVLGESIGEKDTWGAALLKKELEEVYQLPIEIKKEKEFGQGARSILIGEPWKNKKVQDAILKLGLSVTKDSPGKEGYVLAATPEVLVIAGSDERGTYWGVQTLLQLLRKDGVSVFCPEVVIKDFPVLPIRGADFFSSAPLPLDSFELFVERVLVRYKLNTLVFTLDAWFNFPSHPSINAKGIKKEEMEKLLSICQKHFIDVIPAMDCLRGRLYLECPSLKEDPKDTIANGCPSNPETYKMLFDLFKDVEEIWKPYGGFKYFSIECDEVAQGPFGDCERCKKTGKLPPALFADAINTLHDYWKTKGVTTIVVHDSLVTHGTARLEPARKLIAKDILISYWGYMGGASVDECRKDGFSLIGCWQFRSDNIWNFSKQMKESPQGVGLYGLHTGLSPNLLQHSVEHPNGSAWNYLEIYAGDCAWNPGQRPPNKIPYNMYQEYLDRLAKKPNLAKENVTKNGFLVDLTPCLNSNLPDTIKDLPLGEIFLDGTAFNVGDRGITLWGPLLGPLPEKVVIPVNKNAKSLVFLHGCQKDIWDDYKGYSGWKGNLGKYKVWLEGDVGEKIELVTCESIQAFAATPERELRDPASVAWQGEKGRVYTYKWENPYPGRKIEKIEFISSKTKAGPMLLAITGLDSRALESRPQAVNKEEKADSNLLLDLNFNAGAGTIAKDKSLSAYDGEWAAEPRWTEGARGLAAEFNGKDNSIAVNGEKIALSDKSSFSINLWVKPEEKQKGRYRIFMTGGNDWSKGTISMTNGGFSIAKALENVGPKLSPGTWQMATFIYDSEKHTASAYLNGELVKTMQVGSFEPASKGWVRLGAGQCGTYYPEGYFKGTIDEFKIYSRVLLPEEIKTLYAP